MWRSSALGVQPRRGVQLEPHLLDDAIEIELQSGRNLLRQDRITLLGAGGLGPLADAQNLLSGRVGPFARLRPLLWVCREQLAQGGKRTQRNEFETHQVFADKRQRLHDLLGHRGIGGIEDQDDTRTVLTRVPLVDLAS